MSKNLEGSTKEAAALAEAKAISGLSDSDWAAQSAEDQGVYLKLAAESLDEAPPEAPAEASAEAPAEAPAAPKTMMLRATKRQMYDARQNKTFTPDELVETPMTNWVKVQFAAGYLTDK